MKVQVRKEWSDTSDTENSSHRLSHDHTTEYEISSVTVLVVPAAVVERIVGCILYY
jgi:hypothetical protein